MSPPFNLTYQVDAKKIMTANDVPFATTVPVRKNFL
jgi:hypothetical protein